MSEMALKEMNRIGTIIVNRTIDKSYNIENDMKWYNMAINTKLLYTSVFDKDSVFLFADGTLFDITKGYSRD